jgi:hypothetical protein
MRSIESEYFEVVDLASGVRVTLRRDYPVVDGVRMLAPHAVAPDGVSVFMYPDGTYYTDDGRQYRAVSEL